MKTIHILGDDRREKAIRSSSANPSEQGWVRLHDEGKHLLEHGPDFGRIRVERIDVAYSSGSYLSRDPEPPGNPECRSHGDAGAGEGDRLLRFENIFRRLWISEGFIFLSFFCNFIKCHPIFSRNSYDHFKRIVSAVSEQMTPFPWG